MSQAKAFSLILLYDKMAASLPVAQALKEKNIEVQVAQNAGELIQMIAQKNVDLAGLSANHASTRSLIQVLREKTKVKILVFGEDKSQATAERVDKLDCDFKVLGVATAYNIWMKIAHVVKLKMKDADNGNILYSGGKATQNRESAIIVKNQKKPGFEKKDSDVVSFSKKKKEKKFEREKTQEKNDPVFTESPESAEAVKSNLLFFKKDPAVKKNKDKAKKAISEEQSIDEEVSAAEKMFKEPFKKSGKNVEAKKEQGGVKVDEQAEQTEQAMQPETDIGDVALMQENQPAEGKLIKLEKKKKKKDIVKSNDVKEASSEEHSIPLQDRVLKATQSTFVAKETTVDSFGPINKMTVVPIDHHENRGFLVFCTNDNQFLNSGGTTADAFKNILQENMTQQEAVGLGECYNIETEEIDLPQWVLNNSDFHYVVEDPKSQKQILICFISKEHIYPDTNKSSETDMLKVELEVIPVQTPINFNLFLYFARNKRLIPYLRRGGRLTEDQMSRLEKHGVDTIYISESDRKALYSFFISQTIHQDLRPAKKAA
ncbi:hypothetical protein K2X05_14615 [bacterium]|nr:hypothetical protein [bacterium]